MTSTSLSSLVLAVFLTAHVQDWRTIVPAQSTRADVERILGHADTAYFARYKLSEGSLFIEYSSGPCRPDRKGGWNLAENVVVSVVYSPVVKPRLSELKVNRKKLRRVRDPHVGEIVYYINDAEDVVYEIQDGRVWSIEYGPAKQYEHLKCPDSAATPKRGSEHRHQ